MKLLFICTASVRDGVLKCPSWIKGILGMLDPSFEATVLSDAPSDAATAAVGQNKIRILTDDCRNDPVRFADIIRSIQPGAIIIFGTEGDRSHQALALCKAAGVLDKTAVFMQGLACVCARHYAEGVPHRIIRRWTIRDILRRENIAAEQKKMAARAEREKEIIKTARHFIGRTAMDRAVIASYHPDARYYRCNDILRDSFYDGRWSYADCEPHRIFISQYYYPLKGFHYLLEAASLLKEKYPDIRIAAAGYNPIQRSITRNELKDSSYIRYIKSLIRRYGLEDHIEMLGVLDGEQMKAQYLKANAFVLPSTIENSPNSLAEAMMLGVPCAASDVGGVTDFAEHKKSAFIYPSSAVYLLAHWLDVLFSDKEQAQAIGAAARERAEKDYDRESNIRSLERVFMTISKMNET